MSKMIKRLSPLPVAHAIAFLLVQVLCDLYIPTLTADMVNSGIVKGDTGLILQLGIIRILVSTGGVVMAYRLSPSLSTVFIIIVPIVALAAIGISVYANPLYAKMQKTIDSYRAYDELYSVYEGPLDPEKAAEAKRVYDEVSARYGTDSQVIARSIKDRPEIILAVKYHEFAGMVDDHLNGTPPESTEEPYGIALLQWKLSELESQGKQNTFEYKELADSWQTLIALGGAGVREYLIVGKPVYQLG